MTPPPIPHLVAVEFNAQAWAPTAAAAIALLSLIVAIVGTALSNKKSNRALKIAESQEERQVARLNCEVEKTGHWKASDGTNVHWAGAYVFLENPTDRDGSVSRAELTINYIRNNSPIVVRVLHKESSTKGNNTIGIPLRMPANSAARGWVTFPIYPESIDYREIVGLSVEFSDSRGITIDAPIWPVKEWSNDPTQ